MSPLIPKAALAQHVIALGKTRSGKSSKMRLLVEGLLADDQPVCIIDPKGDWWGIKSSADGKSAGYPVVIFGGEHADVPINAHSGAAIAELIATGNRPSLIDLGGWMVGERTRFFIEFAQTFFKTSKGIRHLVIDEVHNFAPKGKIMDPDAGKCLHWANRLASEGQGKGIILIGASQRPQKVHNDFLTSCETLIACRVIHKADRDAIKDWIDGCADATVGKTVLAELAGMQRPEAWVWSPEIDFGPKRLTFPMFSTFDSFKPRGTDTTKLKGWAEVDLSEVKAKLATVVEQAASNDPVKLKARIAELERQAKRTAAPAGAAVDVPAIERAAFSQGRTEGWKTAAGEIARRVAEQLRELAAAELKSVDKLNEFIAALSTEAPKVPASGFITTSGRRGEIPRFESVKTPAPQRTNGSSEPISKAAQKILAVLSQYPEGCEAGKLTLLTGYRYTGSFKNALSELRMAGYIDGGNTGTMRITDAGLGLGPFPQLPEGAELLQYWLTHPSLGAAARKILGELATGEALTAEQLCRSTGYQYTGSFKNALSELRTAGVITGRNTEAMRISREIVS